MLTKGIDRDYMLQKGNTGIFHFHLCTKADDTASLHEMGYRSQLRMRCLLAKLSLP